MNKSIITVNFTGNKIGLLRVTKWYGPCGLKRDNEWLCQCSCGKNYIKSRYILTNATKMD